MAARSTRRKIRDQGEKINQDLLRVIEHLRFLSELADNQSAYINLNMPRVVLLIQGTAQVMEQFTDGL